MHAARKLEPLEELPLNSDVVQIQTSQHRLKEFRRFARREDHLLVELPASLGALQQLIETDRIRALLSGLVEDEDLRMVCFMPPRYLHQPKQIRPDDPDPVARRDIEAEVDPLKARLIRLRGNRPAAAGDTPCGR